MRKTGVPYVFWLPSNFQFDELGKFQFVELFGVCGTLRDIEELRVFLLEEKQLLESLLE